ncbi:MAG: HEAT repeat domain-containing protein, partial [Limisphaerales bacterium]
DFTHGRIWRVTAKNRPLVLPPKFNGASDREVLEYLKSSEDFTRMQAKRVLSERDPKNVLPALADWVKKLNPNDPDYDHQRLEALWTYQTLNVVEPNLLKILLRANDFNARAGATALIRYWHNHLENPVELLASQIVDDNPRVRLQAVIALSYIPEKRALDLAMSALDKTMDRYLEQALKNTATALKNVWEPALISGELIFAGDPKKLQLVLEATGSSAGARALLKLLQAEKISPAHREKTIELIAAFGDADDLATLYHQRFDSPLQEKVLDQLAKTAREKKLIPKVDPSRLNDLLNSTNENVAIATMKLAGAWNRAELRPDLVKIAENNSVPEKLRIAALNALATPGEKQNLALLQKFAGPQFPVAMRAAAIIALTEIDLKIAAQRAAEFLANPPQNPAPIFNAFLGRKDGAEILGQSLMVKKIAPDNAKLGLRLMQAAGRQDKILLRALNDAAGIGAETKPLSAEELQKIISEVQTEGDAARGEKIFRRAELNCFQCHAIAGAGGQVGPDLSAVGSGSTVDYLIESLLFPSKILKDGFETIEVITKDDEYFLGVKVRENKNGLALKDAARGEIVIPLPQIKEKQSKPVSLMPSGLANDLTHEEFLDLVRFLSELGKPGPYANNPKPMFRRWRISDSASADLVTATSTNQTKINWQPLYSLVSGDLPLEFLPTNSNHKIVWARAEIEITTPGKIQLHFNSADGLELWVDDLPVAISEN